MQFDVQRAFPYPVLRPGNNDYLDGEFQVTAEFEIGESPQPINIRFTCNLSVEEIESLIGSGQATFAIVVSCRETFTRRVILNRDTTFSVAFDQGELKGQVVVSPFVATTTTVLGYCSKLLNPEWGNGAFDLEPGSILAADEPQVVFVDRDLFRPITSVFTLVKNDNIQNNEWHVSLDEDKVQISVSPQNKEVIDRVRNSDASKAVLINSLYFGAVTQCLRHLKNSRDFDEYRWARVMRAQLEAAGFDIDTEDEYLVAQKLMKHPLGLLNAYVFPEDV